MKQFLLILGTAGAVLASNSQAAIIYSSGTAHLDWPTEGGGNNGGPFLAHTSNNGTFDTFCISIGTVFYPNAVYTYELSDTVRQNASTPQYPAGSSYIAAGTALIYHNFAAQGTSWVTGTGRGAALNAIQEAIWYYQGELTVNGYTDPENGNNFLNDPAFNTILGIIGDNAAEKANGHGAYGVVAFNLGAPSGTYQPQLAIVPETSTIIAGALLLLPFGAGAIRSMRKNAVA